MFVPGYAVKAGFTDETPSVISVLATAGGQMFFSLSLAMGAMITYGSYLDKKENIVKNSALIVVADSVVALMAGLAVIPAAVANGIASGTPLNEIALGGPKLLFVTLQDVFANMGPLGPLFGIVFYLLVIIAAISSAISLMEVVAAHFIDKAAEKGRKVQRSTVTLWVSFAILIEALLVAVDGLGANGVWVPLQGLFSEGLPMFNDCWLDFMDFFSEGLMMPLGAMVMALMVGWELKPSLLLDEIHHGEHSPAFSVFYTICIRFICPVVMAFVLAGQLIDFFTCPQTAAYIEPLCYALSAAALVVFWLLAALGNKKTANI